MKGAARQAAVFFDRDNTLIVSAGYLGDPGQVRLVKGAARCIALLRAAGFVMVTCSNQSGVARGYFDESSVQAVNARMDELLRQADSGAIIDRHEYCPFHPEAAVEAYRRQSDLRKPEPGMLLKAARELNLDLSKSWMIGDAPRDIAAGKAAGCRTIFFHCPGLAASPAAQEAEVAADFVVKSLMEAAERILASA